jgi:uncharacterized protein YcnI
MTRRHSVAAVLAVLAALPASVAQAHVTLQPNELPAGGFKKLDVRVPNERDKAGTSKVVVQFPEGFNTVSYEAVDGWKIAVKRAKLATPIEVEGEKVTERLDTVTLTAEKGEEIQPGEYRDFGLSLRMPEEPAPQVKLTAAPAEGAALIAARRGRTVS